jgi:hypothetical protein
MRNTFHETNSYPCPYELNCCVKRKQVRGLAKIGLMDQRSQFNFAWLAKVSKKQSGHTKTLNPLIHCEDKEIRLLATKIPNTMWGENFKHWL